MARSKRSPVTDRDTGRSRGFGFVEMTNASDADKAVAALNGTDLGGRTLTINEAKPKSDRPRGAEAIVLAAEADVPGTITAVIHGSRGNRAGSFFEHNVPGDVAITRAAGCEQRIEGEYLCQETDQPLQSAKRNRRGNRDKRTRQSAGTNEGRRSLWKAVWMRWPNCGNMPQHRRRYSTLAWRKLELRRSPRPMAALASEVIASLPKPDASATRFRNQNVDAVT